MSCGISPPSADSLGVVCQFSRCTASAYLLCGMLDLTSQIKDQTCIPCIARQILNHWTTREVPQSSLSLIPHPYLTSPKTHWLLHPQVISVKFFIRKKVNMNSVCPSHSKISMTRNHEVRKAEDPVTESAIFRLFLLISKSKCRFWDINFNVCFLFIKNLVRLIRHE